MRLMSGKFRRRLLSAGAALLICSVDRFGVSQTASTAPVPVLVELFTSEGCSDCPPADALLQQVDAVQPVAGVHAIVLSEHVTYWDHQGWKDPFSLEEMTQRQQEYGFRFGLRDSYTPQAVVDGAVQFVGSDARAMSLALADAATKTKQTLTMDGVHWENGAATFNLRGAQSPNERVVVALAADATHSEVARGENAGRTLHHVAVVRVMKQFGAEVLDGRVLHLPATGLGRENAAMKLRLVAFVTDRKTGHVLGAAEEVVSIPGNKPDIAQAARAGIITLPQ